MVLSSLAEMAAAHRVYARLGYARSPDRDWAPDARRPPDRLQQGAAMTETRPPRRAAVHGDRRRHGRGARQRLAAGAGHAAAARLVRGGHLRRDRAALPRGRDLGRAPGSRWSTWPPPRSGPRSRSPPARRTSTGGCTGSRSPPGTPATGSSSAAARSPASSSTPSGSCPPSEPRLGSQDMRRASAPSVRIVGSEGTEAQLESSGPSDQALGRLPWFAAFLRRERRLRPVLPMVSS